MRKKRKKLITSAAKCICPLFAIVPVETAMIYIGQYTFADSCEFNNEVHEFVDCRCVKCNDIEIIDEQSKALILSREIYESLGLQEYGTVTIPETVTYNGEQYKVVGIGETLFQYNENIVEVRLPETIWYIGGFSFDQCTNLERINLPDSVRYIGKAAFQCCYKLEELTLPESLEEVKGFGYNHCSGINNSVLKIGKKVKQIGDAVMAPAHMFYDFGKDGVFQDFEVDKDNPYYMDVDGILYTKDGRVLVSIPRGKTFENDTYIMPDTVETLGELSFSRNTNIRKVVISDNLRVSSFINQQEMLCYNNFGNDMARAVYVYSTVEEYETKESNENYMSINGVLYSKDGLDLVAVPGKYCQILDIPEGVTTWDEEAIWTDLGEFQNMIYHRISEVHIPASMMKIDEKQIKALNYMADTYGTKIQVNSENQIWKVDEAGHLARK